MYFTNHICPTHFPGYANQMLNQTKFPSIISWVVAILVFLGAILVYLLNAIKVYIYIIWDDKFLRVN